MRISSYLCRFSWCSPASSARANQDPYSRTIESVPFSYCPISFRLLRHRVPSSRDPYRPNAHTRQMDSVGPGMPRAIEAAGPGPPSELCKNNGNVLFDRLFGSIFHHYLERGRERRPRGPIDACHRPARAEGRLPCIIYLAPHHVEMCCTRLSPPRRRLGGQTRKPAYQPDRI